MKYYQIRWRGTPPANAEYPCVILMSDGWNDFNYYTLFHLKYYVSRNSFFEIGDVKIAEIEKTITNIPEEFDHLNPTFCSLGQSPEYYITIHENFPTTFREILDPINDVAINPSILERFEDQDVFKTSLLRWSEANKALKEGRSILEDVPLETNLDFTFKCQLDGAVEKHKAHFNFNSSNGLPHRIYSIVGKNGTGKTQYISRLALTLSGQNPYSKDQFEPHRPLFSKVIALSYSAFDKFTRPTKDESFSYKYFGLKDKKGFISLTRLIENYKISVETIKKDNRQSDWYNILKEIISNDLLDMYYDDFFEDENFDLLEKEKGLLSSGQSVLMYVITGVVANIRPESLILFDEPEMHLHPHAIANLIRMLHNLLEKYNSYCILATHSPIILQEIPSKFVTVFDRQTNTPIIYNLESECFGENISTITDTVFNKVSVESTYKGYLTRLTNELSFDQIMEMFDNRLSFNATLFLKSQFDQSQPR